MTPGEPAAGQGRPQPAARHVLVIEDGETNAALIRRSFGAVTDRYRLSLVRTIREARAVLESDPPDLIIAGWHLPDGRGIDILPLKDGRVTTPLIIMTNHGDPKTAVQMMKSGAIDYVVKSAALFHDLPQAAGQALQEWEAIRQRKREEGAVREAGRRLADITCFLPDATFAIDAAGKVIAWNHAIEQMTGIPAAAMIGKGDHEYSIPFYGERRPILIDLVLDGDPEAEKAYHSLQREGDRITSEAFIPVLFGGKGGYLWGTAVPLYDHDGTRIGAIETIRDITERKQTELALQEAGEKYRLLVDNLKEIVWQSTPALVFTYLSPRVEDLTGFAPEELVGTCLFDLLTPESAGTVRERLSRRLGEDAAGRQVSATVFEIEILTKNGLVVPFEVSSSPVRNPDGTLAGFSGITRDITERRQAEAALRESEQRFHDLFNNMSPGVAIYEAVDGGEDFIIRDINRAVETIEQVTRDGTVGHRLREVFPGVEEIGLLEVFRRVWKTGIAEHHPVSRYRDQRITGWRENYVYKLGSGEIAAIYEDVTGKMQAASALRESEEKFRTVVENVPDLIIVHDGSEILYVNGAGPTVTGYTEAEILHRPLTRFIAPEFHETVLSAVRQRMEGIPVGLYEIEILKKDGSRLAVMVRGSTFEYAGRMASLNILTDITERKKAESGLRQHEMFLNTLIDTLTSPIFSKDRDGRYTGCNTAFEQLAGMSREELAGKSVYDLWPRDLADQYAAKDKELLEHPGTQTYEGQIRYADGSIHDVIFNKSTLADPGGKVNGLVGVILDITDRKRSEGELRKSQLQLGDAMDLAHLANWEFDVAGSIFTFNDRFYSLYGTTAEREGGYRMHAGDYTRRFVHPDDQEMVAREVEKAVRATDPQFISQAEHRIVRRDGAVRNIVVRFGITKDENGKTIRTQGVNQDITDRKKMESALRESEVRFRSLIQNSSDIIRVINADGKIVYDSPSSARILGYPPGSLAGQDPLEYVHPDDREKVAGDFAQVVRRKNTGVPTEFRLRRSDGSYIYVESVAVNLIDVPEINGIVVNTRPIQERKMAEISLRESEEKFRRIFNSANDGIIIIDITPSGLPGRIRDINDVQCARLGYERRELQQKLFSEIITPESTAKLPAFMAGVLAKGQGVFEAVFPTRDGALLETEMSSHVIRFRDKNILIGIARDITRRKKEEAALRLVNQKLQLMNIVAWHDIQNKITGLRGYVELSKEMVTDPRASQFLLREEEILKTIHDYIQYTKEYQEMGTRPMQWVNIPQLIAGIQALIEMKDVAVEVDVGDLWLYSDPVIERVFSHLMENTAAHGKHATLIRIRAEESPAGLTLTYTDNGVGIPEDQKESIFVRDVAKGSGFSLYFIHDILDLSGMSIRETGEPGAGVRFVISVPKGSYRTGAGGRNP